MKDTIFVFKKVSILEQEIAYRDKQIEDKNNKVLDLLNTLQFFEFKKNEIKNKKLHNINLSLKTFTAFLQSKRAQPILVIIIEIYS